MSDPLEIDVFWSFRSPWSYLATPRLRGRISPVQRVLMLPTIMAPTNTKALSQVDPALLARNQQGSRPIMEAYYRRSGDQSLRWNITAWPTQSAAQEADMGLLAYSEFVYNACGLNHDDPVAYWQGTKTRQQHLVEWLAGMARERMGPDA